MPGICWVLVKIYGSPSVERVHETWIIDYSEHEIRIWIEFFLYEFDSLSEWFFFQIYNNLLRSSSLLSCTNMNFISFLYFPLQYCFEIYSADNSSSLIKACKTDSEGKVVEGLCVCFTILICHGTLCSYPSHQAVSFTWSVCRTPWCLSHLCSFWRRKRNLDWVYKVSCFLVCSIIITHQRTLEFVLRSMSI